MATETPEPVVAVHVAHAASGPASRRVQSFLSACSERPFQYPPAEEYPSVFAGCPGGTSLVIERDGFPVAHLAYVVREYHHAAFRWRVGCISSVVTLPQYRGRGFASALMHTALAELRTRGCTLAVLWSDNVDFYGPLGFVRAGREKDFLFEPGSEGAPGDGADLAVQDYDRSRHAHWVWRLYLRSPGHLDRSLEELKALCDIPRTRVVVMSREGKITAYFAVNKGSDFTNYVHEWAGLPGDVATGVARSVRDRFAGASLTLISPAYVDTRPFQAKASASWEGVLGLVQILDPTRAMDDYRAYLSTLGISFSWDRSKRRAIVGEERISVEGTGDLARLILGSEASGERPVLPFFLWGFDSV